VASAESAISRISTRAERRARTSATSLSQAPLERALGFWSRRSARSRSALMGSKIEDEAQGPLDGAQFVGRDVTAPVVDA